MRKIVNLPVYYWIIASIIDLNERNEKATCTEIKNLINESKKSPKKYSFYDIKQKLYYLDGSKKTGFNLITKGKNKEYNLNYENLGILFINNFLQSDSYLKFKELKKSKKHLEIIGSSIEAEIKIQHQIGHNLTLKESFNRLKDEFVIKSLAVMIGKN